MSGEHDLWATRWDLLGALPDKTPRSKRESLDALIRQYRQPVLMYIRARVYTVNEAEEIAQDFFCSILQGGLFEHADPNRGKFRCYLLKALKNHIYRHLRGKYRTRAHSLDVDDAQELTDGDQLSEPEQAFHRAWAAALLDEALADCRGYYAYNGPDKLVDWAIFEDRVLLPILEGVEPLSLPQISCKHGVPQEKLSSIIVNVKRQLSKAIHRALERYAGSARGAADELADLIRILG